MLTGAFFGILHVFKSRRTTKDAFLVLGLDDAVCPGVQGAKGQKVAAALAI
jgi:hypothetical protein